MLFPFPLPGLFTLALDPRSSRLAAMQVLEKPGWLTLARVGSSPISSMGKTRGRGSWLPLVLSAHLEESEWKSIRLIFRT